MRTVSRSVERAFAIIALFKERRSPLSASEVRRALDAPHTSIHSILGEMTDLGYLSFDRERKTYFPTVELEFLCNWIQRSVIGSSAFAHVTDTLAAQVNETASLTRQHHIFTTVVYVKRPEQPLAVQLPMGNLGAPMCQTVVGRVLLSMMSDPEIEKLIGFTNRWSKITKAGFNFKAADILEVIEKIRRDGYLYEQHSWLPGLSAVAAPIPSKAGINQNMALAVAATTTRMQPAQKKILAAIRSAARELAGTR